MYNQALDLQLVENEIATLLKREFDNYFGQRCFFIQKIAKLCRCVFESLCD